MLDKVKQILGDKAELIFASFQEPASENKLSEIEEMVGVKLPEDFYQLYRDSNGFKQERKSGNLFYGFQFSSLEIIERALNRLESENDAYALKYSDPQIKSTYNFGRKRIPIGDDSGTCVLCVDLDPTEKGTVGQVIIHDYDMGVALLLNESISEMVNQFENDLLADKYHLQEDALEGGRHWLTSHETALDPINWSFSLKWQYVIHAAFPHIAAARERAEALALEEEQAAKLSPSTRSKKKKKKKKAVRKIR